jgi:hypothetical protein
MTDVIPRKPPLPTVQSFLTCNEIFRDQQKHVLILLGPTAHVPVPKFPAHVRLAMYAEFTGGHGSYTPRMKLYDEVGDVVWSWSGQSPFEHSDPLRPTEVTFDKMIVAVPKPGRYSLALLLNEDEAAQRTLWFGPLAAFRAPDTV